MACSSCGGRRAPRYQVILSDGSRRLYTNQTAAQTALKQAESTGKTGRIVEVK